LDSNIFQIKKAIPEVDKVSNLIIRAEHLVKDYPGTRALDDVSITFESGKVNALVGKTVLANQPW